VSSNAPNQARVIPLRPVTTAVAPVPARSPDRSRAQAPPCPAPAAAPAPWTRPAQSPSVREPLWRHIVGDVLRRQRLAQERTLKDVAETARISMPYLSEIERGRKEPSSEVLAAAARALGLGLADLLGLAQGELARIARPRPGKAPAPVRPRHGFGPRPAGPAGHDHNAVPPADAAPPAETVLPVETVPSAEAFAPAETVLPAETVPPAQALGIRRTGQVTSQLRMSLAA
jgi:transcriptional regulator with XRE-family HTH domain